MKALQSNQGHLAHLNLEQLEARDTPSGNVSAFVSGNDLYVIGDGNLAGNQVQISQDTYGNVIVAGLYGTLVNGQSAVIVGTGVPNRVSVQFGGTGPDYVELVTLTANSVDVATGAGNDGIVMLGVNANWVSADAGAGDDGVDLRGVSSWYGTSVSGGDGFDTLYLGPVYGPTNFQQFEQSFPAG
jgi:hypothetical protein